MSKPRPFSVGTHQGKVRSRNEDFVDEPQLDAAVVGSKGMLFIVADGVGGAKDGDVASQMAVRAMRDTFNAQPHPDVRECLSIAISAANSAVFREGQRRGKPMATTLTAAVIRPDGIVTANVGDSRVYLCNKARGTIQQLTVDHTELQEAVNNRKISPEAARQMPRSGAITRALGVDAYVTADVTLHPSAVEKGSVLLLCTDGLYSEVPDAVMATVLRKAPTDEAVRRLTQMALTAGGRDNVTLAVVDVDRVVEVVKGEMKRGAGTAGLAVGGSHGVGASAGGSGEVRQAAGPEMARTIGETGAGTDVVHATLGRRVHRESRQRASTLAPLEIRDEMSNTKGQSSTDIAQRTDGSHSSYGKAVAPMLALGAGLALVAIVLLPEILRSQRNLTTKKETPTYTPAAITVAVTEDATALPATPILAISPSVPLGGYSDTMTDTPSPTNVATTRPTPAEATVGASPTATDEPQRKLKITPDERGCIHIEWDPRSPGDVVEACITSSCSLKGIYEGDSTFWWDPSKEWGTGPGKYQFRVRSADHLKNSTMVLLDWGGGSCDAKGSTDTKSKEGNPSEPDHG